MHIDPITEEIRAFRRSFAAAFDNDLSRIVADLRQRETASGRTFAQLPKRPARSTVVAEQSAGHNAPSDAISNGEGTARV